MNKVDTIRRISDERHYEEEIIIKVKDHLINCIDGVKDISEDERRQIQMGLETIITESLMHDSMLWALFKEVLKSEKDNF